MRSTTQALVGGQDALPAYADINNGTIDVGPPSYEEAVRERRLIQRRVVVSAAEPSVQGQLISPPNNQPSDEDGWVSDNHMDVNLAKNIVYLRAVLNHLRDNYNSPLDGELMDMIDTARDTHRKLKRAIRQYFRAAHNQEATRMETKYQDTLSQNPTLCTKAIAWAVHKRDMVLLDRCVKKSRDSRVNVLDDYMYRIYLQKQSMLYRSAGLQQY
ncbi:hypothetical protein LIA77_00625 [Sarocladium implicatum]|jgi:hypothetical protein|nr:hypothetical protein LIA77_00625 [Sarocladium implicatum]